MTGNPSGPMNLAENPLPRSHAHGRRHARVFSHTGTLSEPALARIIQALNESRRSGAGVEAVSDATEMEVDPLEQEHTHPVIPPRW